MECFDRSYGFCEECGITVYHHGQGITRSQHARAYRHNGQTLCGQCRDRLGGCSSDNVWRPQPFDVACVSHERIGSKRKFGVEIETSNCNHYRDLNGRTKFGAKHDYTVNGMEFDSPILYGDEGLEYIKEFLAFGDEHGWSAYTECGCHTHYDMRDESREQLISIAYAYRRIQELFTKFVPPRRANTSYSFAAQWNLDDFRAAVSRSEPHSRCGWIGSLRCERYEMVNYTAYHDHTTYEIRALEGTVDPETICNWIAVNCRFMDAVRDMSQPELDDLFDCNVSDMYENFTTLIGDDDLIAWLDDRMVDLGHARRDSIGFVQL
jgi:hypothetical protein